MVITRCVTDTGERQLSAKSLISLKYSTVTKVSQIQTHSDVQYLSQTGLISLTAPYWNPFQVLNLKKNKKWRRPPYTPYYRTRSNQSITHKHPGTGKLDPKLSRIPSLYLKIEDYKDSHLMNNSLINKSGGSRPWKLSQANLQHNCRANTNQVGQSHN